MSYYFLYNPPHFYPQMRGVILSPVRQNKLLLRSICLVPTLLTISRHILLIDYTFKWTSKLYITYTYDQLKIKVAFNVCSSYILKTVEVT